MFLTVTFIKANICSHILINVVMENNMNYTYLTTDKLAERIHYTPRHIREYLKDRTFLEGIHYVRAPGGRKLLFIWERIEEELSNNTDRIGQIPLSSGGYIHE